MEAAVVDMMTVIEGVVEATMIVAETVMVETVVMVAEVVAGLQVQEQMWILLPRGCEAGEEVRAAILLLLLAVHPLHIAATVTLIMLQLAGECLFPRG